MSHAHACSRRRRLVRCPPATGRPMRGVRAWVAAVQSRRLGAFVHGVPRARCDWCAGLLWRHRVVGLHAGGELAGFRGRTIQAAVHPLDSLFLKPQGTDWHQLPPPTPYLTLARVRQVVLTVAQLSSMVLLFTDEWAESIKAVFLWQQALAMSPATSIPVQCFFAPGGSVMGQCVLPCCCRRCRRCHLSRLRPLKVPRDLDQPRLRARSCPLRQPLHRQTEAQDWHRRRSLQHRVFRRVSPVPPSPQPGSQVPGLHPGSSHGQLSAWIEPAPAVPGL